jgi:hypothetical protein
LAMVWLVDPAVRDSREEDLDFVLFGDLCDDFACAWVDAGLEGEEVDCAVFGIAGEFGRRPGLSVFL